MIVQQMHNELDITLDKVSSLSYPEFEDWEKDFYLNEAYMRFIKTRYSANNVSKKGFEQTQKRIDDLKNIVISRFCKVNKINGTSPEAGSISTENTYRVALDQMFRNEVQWDNTTTPRTPIQRGTPVLPTGPDTYPALTPEGDKATTEKYMFHVQSTANIGISCADKWSFVRLVQQNNFEVILRDPFNKPSPSYPVMYFEEGDIYVCAGDGVVNDFLLTFIKYPKEICLGTYGKLYQECELSEHVQKEIIQLAVSIILENIGSPRTQSQIQVNEQRSE